MITTYIETPRHYAIEEFEATFVDLKFTSWKPAFPTLHNTGIPSLAQWVAMGHSPQERWGANLNRYYSGLGWHAGPHLVVCPDYVWILCDLSAPGVSVSCWNSMTLGIEMVGNFEIGGDEFNAGLGAKVRDNVTRVLAIISNRLGWGDLSDYSPGIRGLHFHRECKRDHHACPGSRVDKSDILARVALLLNRRVDSSINSRIENVNLDTEPYSTSSSVLELQGLLNDIGCVPPLALDGILGPATKNALIKFQRENGLIGDWPPSSRTVRALNSHRVS